MSYCYWLCALYSYESLFSLLVCARPRLPLSIGVREGERWPLKRAPLDCPPAALERLDWRLVVQPFDLQSGALLGRFVRSGPDTLAAAPTTPTNALPSNSDARPAGTFDAASPRPGVQAPALGTLYVPQRADLSLAESAFELLPSRAEIGPRPVVGRVLLEAVARDGGGRAFRFAVPPIEVLVQPVDNQPPALALAAHSYDVDAGASSPHLRSLSLCDLCTVQSILNCSVMSSQVTRDYNTRCSIRVQIYVLELS